MAMIRAWLEISRAVGEGDDAVLVLNPQAGHLLGQNLDAEALGLGDGAAGQVRAAEAVGEAQIVLDARRRARLAAGGLALDHHGVQALGRPVDGGGQPRRAAADDDQVVERLLGARLEADFFGQGVQFGVGQAFAVGQDDQGQACFSDPE